MRSAVRLMLAAGLAMAAGAVPDPALAQLENAVVVGESTPAGGTYSRFKNPVVSDDAQSAVGFLAERGGGVRGTCVFRSDATGSTVEAVACEKEASPDGGQYRKLNGLAMNSSGALLWSAQVSGNKTALFAEGLVAARRGDAAPGGGFIDVIRLPAINDAGDVIFRARISDGSDDPIMLLGCPTGVQCHDAPAGTLVEIMAQGEAVPSPDPINFPIDFVVCDILAVSASNYGVAVLAEVREDDCAGDDRLAILRKEFNGSIETVAMQGFPALPSFGPGGTRYSSVFTAPTINNDGVVAFANQNSGLIRLQHIYVCDPADCPANPASIGVEGGIISPEGQSLRKFSVPVINDAGDIAFSAQGTGSACGIWVMPSGGGPLQSIVVKGDTVPDEPAKFRCPEAPAMSTGGNIAFLSTFIRNTKPKQGRGVFFDPQ